MIIGELKIHGLLHGENKVSSDLQEEILVVSVIWPLIQTNDHDRNQIDII